MHAVFSYQYHTSNDYVFINVMNNYTKGTKYCSLMVFTSCRVRPDIYESPSARPVVVFDIPQAQRGHYLTHKAK